MGKTESSLKKSFEFIMEISLTEFLSPRREISKQG